ncbi:hypothetical protein Pdsh_06320 [Pyrodictium delaneyi]|nr:hypothetical protein Pdsh_06320 [Pyrodictium delaneyi]
MLFMVAATGALYSLWSYNIKSFILFTFLALMFMPKNIVERYMYIRIIRAVVLVLLGVFGLSCCVPLTKLSGIFLAIGVVLGVSELLKVARARWRP